MLARAIYSARRAIALVAFTAATWTVSVAHTRNAPSVPSASPARMAFLGVYLHNDNETLEPTTAAEHARTGKVAALFHQRIEASSGYLLVPLPEDVTQALQTKSEPGACGGCEIDYGRSVQAGSVSWITVQKVSNLILNLNLYVADVETGQMSFIRSVDIRGNTDESWLRGLSYLLDNYFFAETG